MTLVGLVFDGGSSVSEYTRLSDIAENAARLGAQQVDGLRAGEVRIDSRAAITAGQSYLQAHGVSGNVETSDDSVSVEVTGNSRFQVLGIIGLNSQRLRVTRTASIVSG
jgi:Flp pilus assembly protein TadG